MSECLTACGQSICCASLRFFSREVCWELSALRLDSQCTWWLRSSRWHRTLVCCMGADGRAEQSFRGFAIREDHAVKVYWSEIQSHAGRHATCMRGRPPGYVVRRVISLSRDQLSWSRRHAERSRSVTKHIHRRRNTAECAADQHFAPKLHCLARARRHVPEKACRVGPHRSRGRQDSVE